MQIEKDAIIGDIVAADYRSAALFKKHKIDFCCNGNRTIAQACEQKKIDTDALVAQLNELPSMNQAAGIDYNAWPLDLLADYVEKTHHRYVQNKIPDILPFLNKIVRVHGERHPELAEVEQLFNASASELSAHMKKEELILFPHIRKLYAAQSTATPVQAAFGTVQNPIQVMMQEHDHEGERFRKIAELTNDYTPPADACNTYKVTFSMLKEFEDDLHLHIHIENNILFPKAITLEEKTNKN